MENKYFVIVYDEKSSDFADYISENFHSQCNILYLDENHPKERKQALFYKTTAGTKKCPFVGLFDSETDLIDDALWGEVTNISREVIDTFFKKYLNGS